MSYTPTEFEQQVLDKLSSTDMVHKLLDIYEVIDVATSEANYPSYGDKFDALMLRTHVYSFGCYTIEHGGDVTRNFEKLLKMTANYKNIKVLA